MMLRCPISPVSPETFMSANSFIEFSEITDSVIVFYLHGKLKIDSLLTGNKNIDYTDEKDFMATITAGLH